MLHNILWTGQNRWRKTNGHSHCYAWIYYARTFYRNWLNVFPGWVPQMRWRGEMLSRWIYLCREQYMSCYRVSLLNHNILLHSRYKPLSFIIKLIQLVSDIFTLDKLISPVVTISHVINLFLSSMELFVMLSFMWSLVQLNVEIINTYCSFIRHNFWFRSSINRRPYYESFYLNYFRKSFL
jgi:hypothetical protein